MFHKASAWRSENEQAITGPGNMDGGSPEGQSAEEARLKGMRCVIPLTQRPRQAVVMGQRGQGGGGDGTCQRTRVFWILT